MLKKFLTLLCLAAFVGSMAACGGAGGPSYKAKDDAENAKPLSSENAEEAAATEAF